MAYRTDREAQLALHTCSARTLSVAGKKSARTLQLRNTSSLTASRVPIRLGKSHVPEMRWVLTCDSWRVPPKTRNLQDQVSVITVSSQQSVEAHLWGGSLRI
jgi:hypothetical protein